MKIEPSVSTTEVFASLSYLCHIQLYLFLYKTVYDDVDYLFCIFDWSTISKNFSVNDFKFDGVISLNFNLDSIQSAYSGIHSKSNASTYFHLLYFFQKLNCKFTVSLSFL